MPPTKFEKFITKVAVILVSITMIGLILVAFLVFVVPLIYRYSYMDTKIKEKDPDTYVEVFLRSLLIKDVTLLRELVDPSRWEDIEGWLAKEPTIDCALTSSLDDSEFVGPVRYSNRDAIGSDTLVYERARFRCLAPTLENIKVERLILEKQEDGWLITDWEGLANGWN